MWYEGKIERLLRITNGKVLNTTERGYVHWLVMHSIHEAPATTTSLAILLKYAVEHLYHFF